MKLESDDGLKNCALFFFDGDTLIISSVYMLVLYGYI